MPNKAFTGRGYTQEAAIQNADAACDGWLEEQKVNGQEVTEPDRTYSVEKESPTSNRWICTLTLKYTKS